MNKLLNNISIITLDTNYEPLEKSGLELCVCCKFHNVYGYHWSATTKSVHGLFPENEDEYKSQDLYNNLYENVLIAKNHSTLNRTLVCPTTEDFVNTIKLLEYNKQN